MNTSVSEIFRLLFYAHLQQTIYSTEHFLCLTNQTQNISWCIAATVYSTWHWHTDQSNLHCQQIRLLKQKTSWAAGSRNDDNINHFLRLPQSRWPLMTIVKRGGESALINIYVCVQITTQAPFCHGKCANHAKSQLFLAQAQLIAVNIVGRRFYAMLKIEMKCPCPHQHSLKHSSCNPKALLFPPYAHAWLAVPSSMYLGARDAISTMARIFYVALFVVS